MSQSGEAVTPQSPNSRRVLSASYLEKHKNKKDLVRRLATVANILHTEDVEADSADYPGLAALAACLVQEFLEHRDKEVRLYTVLCCMELFAVYAPEAPWNETEICSIFQQTIRQLANLAHTTQPSQPNYKSYLRILELLATVNIAVVLVEIAKDDALEEEYSENPTEILAELFRTILQSLRAQHPPEVSELAQKCLVGCLEEYSDGVVPIPLVDEILICLGQGPTVTVTVPGTAQPTAKGEKRKQPPAPQKVEQQNRSYMLAASIIRKLTGKFHTDVANLLNGLINNEAHIIERSSIGGAQEDDDPNLNQSGVDVWSIVYELNRVSPPILTTIIGTVSGVLGSPELAKRRKVVKLLGRLFYAKGSKLASKYAPCFRRWLHRHVDVDSQIRLSLVHALSSIIKANADSDVVKQSEEVLMRLLEDKSLEVRKEAVHSVCDLVYEGQKDCSVSRALLQAVGERVKSKDKAERRDALTGIAQIYYRHYISGVLGEINDAGDDCEIGLILQTLSDNCRFTGLFSKAGHRQRGVKENATDLEENKYSWIPKYVLECLFYSDQLDSEMRSRVIQIIDELLLGSDLSKNKSKHLSPTARAAGLTIVMDSVREDGESMWGDGNNGALNHLSFFLRMKANLQKVLSSYIDARAKIKDCEAGTEEAYTNEARAMENLELLASKLPTPSGATIKDVLKKLHSAKDRHIFRILSQIADPKHGKAARSRAIDELPKRTKSLGDPVVAWVKTLVRRCTMGDFINSEIVQHCVLLSLECFKEGDISSCVGLLSCVKFAVTAFPTLLSDAQSFTTLTELFSECQSVSSGKSKKKKDEKKLIDDSGIVTALSSILSIVAPTLKYAKVAEELKLQDKHSQGGLWKRLLQLSHLGTPEQARHAVETMATLFSPSASGNVGRDHNAECAAFAPLLKELTSPSKMTVAASGDNPSRVVSILAALGALAECAPGVFDKSTRSESAIRFSLETILLGRSHCAEDNADNSDDSEGSNEDESDTEKHGDDSPSSKKTPKRKSSSTRGGNRSSLLHKSPAAGCSLLENDDLSLPCRRVCAAIEFLVSYARSTILACATGPLSESAVVRPSAERLKSLLRILTDIIRDQGMPPSNRDRKDCRTRQDRAAIRQCATVQLLRLCDGRLRLDETYLPQADFHILAGSFLDEEKVVRESAMQELCLLLTGKGAYAEKGSPFPPKLRFLALVALCCDGDHSAIHTLSNGGAANVGKAAANVKLAAHQCITLMRQSCDNTYARLRSTKDQQSADSAFEQIKLTLMPEYCIPYCYSLLTFRRETPSTEATPVTTKDAAKRKRNGEEWDSSKALGESQQKMLRKRLKHLFEPLIRSLGESVDNISFLLEMTSSLSAFTPINAPSSDVSPARNSSPSNRLSLDSVSSPEACVVEDEDTSLAQAKLKTVCSTARQVLLSFVKKDSHLAEHPGAVHIPRFLFERKANENKKKPAKDALEDSARTSSVEKRAAPSTVESARSSRSVSFSPPFPHAHDTPLAALGAGVSPIQPQSSGRKSHRNLQDHESEQETKTLSPGDGFTDGETPAKNTPGRRMPKPLKFSPASARSSPSTPGPDDHIQTTSETQSPESQPEAKIPATKKRKTSTVPKQIKIGNRSQAAVKPSTKKASGKENNDGFSFEEDLPKDVVSPAPKRRKSTRRGLRSRG